MAEQYAELLGLYFGDGHITQMAQHELVAAAPWAFLRGCIRSDGSVVVNRTGRYEYLSYDFCNLSQDILGLFEMVCLSLGLRPRRTSSRVRLNRRADVTLLRDHVGIKS